MRVVFRRLKGWKEAKKAKIVLAMVVTLISVDTAAAQNETGVNWTDISNMVSGAASIFPGLADLVMAAIPILIVLAIVGFVLGFFDSILDAIANAGRMFRR